MSSTLRPLERRVLRLLDAGVDVAEVARRFRRSSEHIARVAGLARLPGRNHVASPTQLRPLERCILRWRSQGASHAEIAERFRRSPSFTARVEDLGRYKLAR